MKLSIANPSTGGQKTIDIDDPQKLTIFYEKRMGADVPADSLGPEFKGYVFRITGGQDKEGFAMKQGVLVQGRVRLLIPKGCVGFQSWRGRDGEKRRKSIRGCIVGPDITVLHLIVVKRGEKHLPGITDKNIPNRFGPKRATKIRKLFNLNKDDDVRKYVIRRVTKPKEGAKTKRPRIKSPTIQRLVTPAVIHRRRRDKLKLLVRARKSRLLSEAYDRMVSHMKRVKRDKEDKVKRIRSAARKAHAPLSAAQLKVKNLARKEKRSKAKEAKKAAPKKQAPVKAAPAKTAPVKAAPAKKEAPVQAKKTAPAKKQ